MSVRDLQEGRAAFVAHEWSDVCTHLETADEDEPLSRDDLERLAVARYLVGRELDCVEAWTRAFQASRDEHDLARAARCGFWVGFVLLNRGDLPGGNGWIARMQRGLDGIDADVVETGHVRYLVALRAILEGDNSGACAGFEDAVDVAGRFGDHDLETLARVGRGRALIRLGHPEQAVTCLDEAMVAVSSGEVSPVVVGDSYCTAIEGCHELFDLLRAQRWTEGLSRWCDEHPDLVSFRGQCLIHRAEVLQLRGSWPEALSAVDRALQRLARPAGQLATGAAHYQRGELHRLRGAWEQAEEAYWEARRRGCRPEPGLSLLRLAEGKVADAGASIRRALAETDAPVGRARILPAAVKVLLAASDVDGASAVCDELEATAAEYRSRMLDAAAAQARGALLLARESEDALPLLRRALEQWHALDVPYEAARVHVLLGLASRALGDEEGAQSEWSAARDVFAELGAQPDIEQLDRLLPDQAGDTHGLSPRELEVLQLVAEGRTNREIAGELVISHRTVERHLSNTFTKLDVSSRTAATAYAYEHDLM